MHKFSFWGGIEVSESLSEEQIEIFIDSIISTVPGCVHYVTHYGDGSEEFRAYPVVRGFKCHEVEK